MRGFDSPGGSSITYTTNIMEAKVKKFNSLAELAAFVDGNAPNGYYANRRRLSSVETESPRRRNKFYGTESYAAANDMMLHGWREGAERINAYMTQAPAAVSDRPRNYNAVVGFAPNVPNYIAGVPLNMINCKRVRVPARVVDIIYNCAVSHSVSPQAIEAAAAKLFNVIAGLERGGVRVNLWVMEVSYGAPEYHAAAVKIKTASQPFNLLKMVYPIVHPSFLRRHMFAVKERMKLSESAGWAGYGSPAPKKTSELAASMDIKTANVFSYYSISQKSEKDLAAMIR